MKLYISVLNHAMKLKFSSVLHLPSINKMFQYLQELMILYVAEVYILEHVPYISHLKMSKLGSYVFLVSINTVYKWCHAWVI